MHMTYQLADVEARDAWTRESGDLDNGSSGRPDRFTDMPHSNVTWNCPGCHMDIPAAQVRCDSVVSTNDGEDGEPCSGHRPRPGHHWRVRQDATGRSAALWPCAACLALNCISATDCQNCGHTRHADFRAWDSLEDGPGGGACLGRHGKVLLSRT